MNTVLEDACGWLEEGLAVALATVVAVRRSAPRLPGTKMAVAADGRVAGSVSGGCVEGAVAQEAEAVLRGAPATLLSFGETDLDCGVGLPCGGEIDVWVERLDAGALARRWLELARTGQRGALVSTLESRSSKLLLGADGSRRGSLGSELLVRRATALAEAAMWSGRSELHQVAGATVFVDAFGPPPRLVVVGAVDHAAALCRMARACGWESVVVDPRSRFATPARLPDAGRILVRWPDKAFAELGLDGATAVVVLTHDPKLDDVALLAALRSPAGFVGAMGSRRVHAERCRRLLEAGITAEELDRIRAPVGLDLGAWSPEETALSIIAEIVLARRGGAAAPLSRGQGRIHGAAA